MPSDLSTVIQICREAQRAEGHDAFILDLIAALAIAGMFVVALLLVP